MALILTTIGRKPEDKFYSPKTPVDLVDDFGGTWANWFSYQASAGRLVTLTVPAGSYTVTTDWARSHPGCTIQGAGAAFTTLTGSAGFTTNSFAGVRGTGLSYNNNGETVEPRIATVSAGATSVTLLNPAKSFCFHPGRAVMICGFDVQGFGQPINNDVFEYNRVVSVDGATGVITLENALANTYKSTWPLIGTGNSSEPDPIGSAGIIAMHSNWDSDFTIKDLTVDVNLGGLIQGSGGRSLLFENIIFATDQHIPSVNESFIMRSCELRGFVEMDKMCGLVWYDGCTSTGFVQCQSSSIYHLKVTDSVFTEIQGTGKVTEISDSTINQLELGPTAYGAAVSATLDNVTATTDGSGIGRDANYSSATWTIDTAAQTITISSDNVVSTNALIDLVPGGYMVPLFDPGSGNTSCGPVFKVTDCQEVGSNFVYTIEGLPDPCPQLTDLPWSRIYVHPCPALTVTNTTSGAFKEQSTANGAGRPWGAYYYRTSDDVTYISTGRKVTGLAPSSNRFGYLEEIRINVITPYTGTQGTLTMSPFSGTLGGFNRIVHEDGTQDLTTFSCLINLKTAGERVITSGSVTGNQAGDSISGWTGDREWLCNITGASNGATLSADISGESPSVWPTFTVEFIANHDLWP
jgi:hypothetical protein